MKGAMVGVIDGAGTMHSGPGDAQGVREEVELFSGPDLLFGCRHVPVGGAVAGVVVCSPLPHRSGGGYQSGATYLPDARLGRALARVGIVVQRFHYRGTGHSDGDPGALTLDAMACDARDALARLRDRSGVETLGLVGTAAGAAVAALVARDLPRAPVALWEPYEPASPGRGLTDLLGSGPRPLLVAAAGLGAVEEAVGRSRQAVGVPGAGVAGLADDLAIWRSQGFEVSVVPPADRGAGASLVDATAGWLRDRLAAVAGRR